jgi:hypothetical protein
MTAVPGMPYIAVGMHKAVDSAMGLPQHVGQGGADALVADAAGGEEKLHRAFLVVIGVSANESTTGH